jgi:predicted AlkP superfamily pyrophosphatase or phosphodiesterase
MTSRTASWYHDRALSCCLLAAVLLWASACAARTEKREEARRERPASSSSAARCVIHISVDGLRADAVARLGAARLPNFYRLRTEGTFTDNARTDYDYTVTLPDHACELTSRPVLGPDGHGLTFNYDDGRTLAQIHGSYVAGAFDVTHDNGCATGMYASKSKFDLFERSWNADNGAPDTIGPDNGRDKIDVYVNDANTTSLVATYIADMVSGLMQYSFIHVTDLDDVGHDFGWDSQPYFEALIHVDGLMGRVFDLVDSDAFLTGNTWIIVVADHGGDGTSHSDATDPLNYTVPFYAWGPGVPAGADL